MATTYTWDIAQLERETADGYVYTAHYTVGAGDGTYSAGEDADVQAICNAAWTAEVKEAWRLKLVATKIS